MRKIHFSCNFYSIIKTVGATVLDGLCALAWRNKLALRKKLRNLHAKSQLSSFCSFRDLSVHTDGRKDGQTDMAINPDQEHIYGTETLPSSCYILSDKSSIPFCFTSNGYNYI